MGSFQQFLTDKNIPSETLLRLSRQLESYGSEGRTLLKKRSARRRDKDAQGKSYESLSIGKPKSGRGISAQQLQAALGDLPLTASVRGKLVRAVNAVLGKQGGSPVDAPALFGASPVRRGATAKKSAS
ncbi:hypothetical protein QEG98_15730 [Myxococcus sp. MxC21-1]|uniref:hypothetical protein n=1 Tax=Myxococcus sp. MxC21-1 TaxID=3041439 RepID=UPI0029313B2C|nr:hypothetical protein [Myxococcus sp. MxC21-1]WNZ64963.1 hypothetical protein QEG98_15730 [Myxococcus sp. MxC21-1]